jgi:hypothetical protein
MSHELLSEIPDHFANHLKLIHQLNSDHNEAILKQVDDITNALNKSDIYPVFMKGTAFLLSGLYLNIGERIMSDIDLLVPEQNFLSTVNIMLEMGYINSLPCHESMKSDKHFPRLFNENAAVDVEIHKAPVNTKHSKLFNAEMVLRDKRSVSTQPGCFVPSEEHNFVQNFIHGQLDHQGYLLAMVSFKDLYDLYLLSIRNNKIIYQIPYPRKARNYFTLAEKILDQNQQFTPNNTITSSLFCKRFNLYQHYPLLHKLTIYHPYIFYHRYFLNLLLFITTKSERPRLLNRLKESLN